MNWKHDKIIKEVKKSKTVKLFASLKGTWGGADLRFL